jgi:FkbM family methyltransferase
MNYLSRCVGLWNGFGYGSHSINREVGAVRRFVNGGVLFDVGANQGQYSRELLRVYGPALEALHCFEPAKGLVSEFLRFDDARVRVNTVALGKTRSTGELWKAPGNPGLSSLTKRRLDHFDVAMSEMESVEIMTLDEYATHNAIPRIDLLKLDVEGHELDVLLGAEELLRRSAIKCIQFEFGGCNIDTRTFFQDFWYLLAQSHRFQIHRITPFGPKRIASYSETDEVFLTTNYIAVLGS